MVKITALVPMRHHSQRVPAKNYRNLSGLPLFHHIIRTLSQVPEVNEIVVDTDSDIISDGLKKDFPDVTVLERPERLRADDLSMNQIISYDISQVDSEYYLQTHSTNPLLTAETISRGIRLFLDSIPEYDSLFSVTRLATRLWDENGNPVNHDPGKLIQTQDLPPVYEENSCMYIFSKEVFIEKQNRLGFHPLMFEIDSSEAWDIDEEIDFQISNLLMTSRNKKVEGD